MADLALEIAIDARGVDLVRASQKSRRVNQRKPADPHARGTADASKHHAAWYLDVALGRRREKGLVYHLQVGQGRDEDLVLVGVLAQKRQTGAAIDVAHVNLEQHWQQDVDNSQSPARVLMHQSIITRMHHCTSCFEN